MLHEYDDALGGSQPPLNNGGMDFNEWRLRCPYGKWTCADGREVIFNRSYWPILERRSGEQAKPARPGEWIESIVEEEFFDDPNAVLIEWGLPPLPKPAESEPTHSAEIIPFSWRPRDPKTMPRRQKPWAYPFGSMPKPISQEPEVEEPKVEEPETEEPKELPLLSLADAAKIWQSLPSDAPGLYFIDCPFCSTAGGLGVVTKDIEDGGKTIDVTCDGCDVDGVAMFQRRAEAPAAKLPLINMSNWDSVPVPEQEWTVSDRIPTGYVSLFSGEGAAGKSLIELQRAVDHVLGRDWYGATLERGPALVVDAEDGEAVIHKRLADILEYHGVKFADVVGKLPVSSLVGQDAGMASVSRKSGRI